MSNQLPLFEGVQVEKATLRITKTGDGLSEALELEPRSLRLGDEVFFVLKGVVTQINHKHIEADFVARQHTVECAAVAPIDAKVALKAIEDEHDRLGKLRDAKVGQERIEAMGEKKAKAKKGDVVEMALAMRCPQCLALFPKGRAEGAECGAPVDVDGEKATCLGRVVPAAGGAQEPTAAEEAQEPVASGVLD